MFAFPGEGQSILLDQSATDPCFTTCVGALPRSYARVINGHTKDVRGGCRTLNRTQGLNGGSVARFTANVYSKMPLHCVYTTCELNAMSIQRPFFLSIHALLEQRPRRTA